MKFPDSRRGEATRTERDWWRNARGRERPSGSTARSFEVPDAGFDRRGLRSGSDYYGSRPERYGVIDDWAGGAERLHRAAQEGYEDAAFENPDTSPWQGDVHGIPRAEYRGGTAGVHDEGEFRGRGPRNYRRSDQRIREDACECLTDDDWIDASNIEVEVQDCEITLTGGVNSRREKRRAEDLVENVLGVRDVHNRLRVVNEGGEIEGPSGAPAT